MRDSEITAMTANQIVASNLKRARELRGWTQAQTVEKLRERAGVITTPANLSAAECSDTGTRRREFDADDLLAYARTFQLPISWFLLPPDPPTPLLSTQDDPDGLPSTLLLDYLYLDSPEERERVQELTAHINEPTDYQHTMQQRARHYTTELAAAALDEHKTTPKALHALADAIEQANSTPPPTTPPRQRTSNH